MTTFRNNNNYRRRRFRTGDRNFKINNGESHKFKSEFSSNVNFQRKVPGRNNHNASKLVEKYTDLAREALAHEDKILSENYFQHADHFMRVLREQEKNRPIRAINEPEKNKKTDSDTVNEKESEKQIVSS